MLTFGRCLERRSSRSQSRSSSTLGNHLTKYVVRSSRAQADTSSLAVLAQGLIVSSLIIAFLYIGRDILEPLVIAALLAFILSPLIRRLRQPTCLFLRIDEFPTG